MEIFFILFAVLFWAVKHSISISKEKRARDLLEAQTQLKSLIRKHLEASKEMVDDTYCMIRNEDSREQLFEVLNDELTAVYGRNFKEKIRIRKETNSDIKYMDDGYWMCQLLLAKSGRIGICEAVSGYYLGDNEYAQRNIDYCRQIEKNLLKTVKFGGAYIHLYLTPKRYSVKEDYFYPKAMNSMNFFFNLQHFAEQGVTSYGRMWDSNC